MNMQLALREQIPVRLEEIDRAVIRHIQAVRDLTQERVNLLTHLQIQQALNGEML